MLQLDHQTLSGAQQDRDFRFILEELVHSPFGCQSVEWESIIVEDHNPAWHYPFVEKGATVPVYVLPQAVLSSALYSPTLSSIGE